MIGTAATWAARAAAFIAPDIAGRIPAPLKTVFLTFDDGPSRHTQELLRLLDDAAIVATFFLLGGEIERFPAETIQIMEAGHGIGNHSYRHLDPWRNRWSSVAADLERGSQSIEEVAGVPPRWMRPPYGRLRPSMLPWCETHQQRLVLWDFMAEDFLQGISPDKAAGRVVNGVRSGSIIVLHDGDRHQPRAFEITRRIVSGLVESGWTFDRLPGSGVSAS